MSVAGALEYERPFLGPFSRFLTLHPRTSVRRIHPVCFFHCTPSCETAEEGQTFSTASHPALLSLRADAQASADRVESPTAGPDGQIDVWSLRFSLEITQQCW